MKTADLKAGTTLNALTALAQEWKQPHKGQLYFKKKSGKRVVTDERWLKWDKDIYYQPSDNNPSQCFELIEKFGLSPQPHVMENGIITSWTCSRRWPCDVIHPIIGPEIETAICKAVVASVWGDTIPDDVMESLK